MVDGNPEATEGTVKIKFGGKTVVAVVHNGTVILPKAATANRGRTVGNDPLKGKTARRNAPMRVTAVSEAPGYASGAVTARLVSALGSNTVARLLGVSADRPGRWASGAEVPGEENRMRLIGLDAMIGHLLTVFTPGQSVLWLDGQNAHLGGARPIDVYRINGAVPVIEAMKAHEQGAFA